MGLLEALGIFGSAVLAWWRTPRPEERPYEQPLNDTTVFCAFCSDWHPPRNCAGEWP
jgi:hypothetical protein